jgi:hypothetical protein
MQTCNSPILSRFHQQTDTGKAVASAVRPEFFRLPSSGGDPYFGLTRSFYYEGEKRGYWRLVRLRDRGKLRGVTLIPFDAVASFVRKQTAARCAQHYRE